MGLGLGRFMARVLGNRSARENLEEAAEPEGKMELRFQVTHVTTGPSGRYVNGVYTPMEVIDTGDGIWNVESESGPGEYHTVIVAHEGWVCSCYDYERGRQRWKRDVRTCKHIAMVIARSGCKPALKQVIRSTGEIHLANDNFLDWYVGEGIYERHGVPHE